MFTLRAMNILQIPPGVKTFEMTNSILWFDENGILYSKPKPKYIQATRLQMEADMVILKEKTGGKKVFMIAEGHPQAESPRKEDRDYISQQLSELVKALALLTPSAVSRMVANLFFMFKPPAFPMKMFVSVSDAKEWLRSIKGGPQIPMMFAA